MGMQPVVIFIYIPGKGKENYYLLCPQSQSGHSVPELLSTSINQLIKMQSEINMGTIIIPCPYLWESEEEVEECQVCCVDEEDNNCKFEAHLRLPSSLNSNRGYNRKNVPARRTIRVLVTCSLLGIRL